MPQITSYIRLACITSLFGFLFLLPTQAQTFEAHLLNRGQLFASGALLQDYDDDGDPDIILIRKRDNERSGGIEWLENDGTGRFPRHELTEDLLEPAHFKVGDLDGDGDQDYVVADKGTSQDNGELVLFERQDDGTYRKHILEANRRFDEVDLADFDGDDDLDIVGVGFWQDSLNVWFNEGGLTFTKTTIHADVNQVVTVEAEDVDGDDDVDILVDDMLLKNDGQGNFSDIQELFTWSTGSPSAGRDFVVADLNADGKKDILTFATVGTGGLYFLDGADDFSQSPLDREGVDLGGSLLVHDVDGNGRPDIIRQNTGGDYLAILYQDDSLTFRREFLEQHWDNDLRSSQMALGDLDDDGDFDLVFPEDGNVDGDISWFENIDGVFYRHYLYHEVQAARRPQFGDLDGDGDLDVVLAAGNDQGSTAFSEREIVWYENRGGLGFFESRIEDNIYYPSDLELADLDGDEVLDVVATGVRDSTVYWYKKNGPTWDRFAIEEQADQPRGITVADVDSDGSPDIVVATLGDNGVSWYRNAGSGNFTRKVVDTNLLEPLDIEATDVNGDRETDLVVIATDRSNAVTLYTNDGTETFTKQVLFTDHEPVDVEVGDWTGDGAVDIIVGFNTRSVAEEQNIVLFTNDGTGGFSNTPLYVTNQELIYALKLADIDRDEDPDLVFASQNIKPALALLPNNAGVAGDVVVIRDLNTDDFSGIDAGDIDGDGDLDLVAAGSDSESLVLFTNQEFEPVAVEHEAVPARFALRQNYPNPFNPSTQISFLLPQASYVTLKVFDMLGREVGLLIESERAAGEHTVAFDGGRLPSGVYLYRLVSGTSVQTKKMILLK